MSKPRQPRDQKPTTYGEMLHDPRWQKKRLEIFGRDGFECLYCGSKEKTLHVHHTRYKKWGTPPWEYDDDTLMTLCMDCHEERTVLGKRITALLADVSCGNELEILGYLQGIAIRRGEDAGITVESHEHAVGLGAVFGLTGDQIIALLNGRVIADEDLNAAWEAKIKYEQKVLQGL